MNLSPDTIWETLRNVKYGDITHLCQTNRQFAQVCRSPQAQALFKLLQQQYQESPKYQEKQIDRFLDEVYTNRLSVRDLLWKNQNPLWEQAGLSIINSFIQKYPRVSRTLLEEVAWRGADTEYVITGKRNPTIEKYIQDVDREFLTKNYDLLPDLRKTLNYRKSQQY